MDEPERLSGSGDVPLYGRSIKYVLPRGNLSYNCAFSIFSMFPEVTRTVCNLDVSHIFGLNSRSQSQSLDLFKDNHHFVGRCKSYAQRVFEDGGCLPPGGRVWSKLMFVHRNITEDLMSYLTDVVESWYTIEGMQIVNVEGELYERWFSVLELRVRDGYVFKGGRCDMSESGGKSDDSTRSIVNSMVMYMDTPIWRVNWSASGLIFSILHNQVLLDLSETIIQIQKDNVHVNKYESLLVEISQTKVKLALLQHCLDFKQRNGHILEGVKDGCVKASFDVKHYKQ